MPAGPIFSASVGGADKAGPIFAFTLEKMPGSPSAGPVFSGELTSPPVPSTSLSSNFSHSAVILPAGAWSSPFEHEAMFQGLDPHTGPIQDSWITQLQQFAGPMFDHEAERVPDMTGPIFDHNVEAFLLIRPLDPNTQAPAQDKIPTDDVPACVGTGSTVSPGTCGREEGLEPEITRST